MNPAGNGRASTSLGRKAHAVWAMENWPARIAMRDWLVVCSFLPNEEKA